MKHRSRGKCSYIALAAALSLCIALLIPAGAQAQHMSWQTSKSTQPVVFLYPLQLSVSAGRPTAIDLHFRITNGLHINSHTPTSKSFIRTELIVPNNPNTRVYGIDFPPGTPYAEPAFPQDKLSVYTGEFTVHAMLTATRGEHLLRAKLRYQACATNSCYPPRTAPIVISVIGK